MGYDDQHPPAQTPGAISERGVATPWHEDYEFPASVGPVSRLFIVYGSERTYRYIYVTGIV